MFDKEFIPWKFVPEYDTTPEHPTFMLQLLNGESCELHIVIDCATVPKEHPQCLAWLQHQVQYWGRSTDGNVEQHRVSIQCQQLPGG